jgi:hypothetical protein
MTTIATGREPDAPAARRPTRIPSALSRPVLYPNAYVWYVFLAALDVMLTWLIVCLDGSELNALADRIIWHGDLFGLIAYKFGLVTLVVCICEYVGRRHDRIGRRLAEWAVAISAIPITLAFVQLLYVTIFWPTHPY